MSIPLGTIWVVFVIGSCHSSPSCSDKGTTSSIQFNVTCDDYLTVYVDGKLLGEGNTGIKSRGFRQYEIQQGSQVVALKCKGKPPPWEKAILGSLGNGLVTDNSWKCTNSVSLGWNMRNYQDDSWPMAASHGPNSAQTFPWGDFDSIDSNALWIWTNDNVNDFEVYCRLNIVLPCTKVQSSFFQTMQPITDIALEGFLLRQVNVASDTECGFRCSQHSACVSFTAQQLEGPGPRMCELYNASAKSHPKSVVKRKGYRYYERVYVYY